MSRQISRLFTRLKPAQMILILFVALIVVVGVGELTGWWTVLTGPNALLESMVLEATEVDSTVDEGGSRQWMAELRLQSRNEPVALGRLSMTLPAEIRAGESNTVRVQLAPASTLGDLPEAEIRLPDEDAETAVLTVDERIQIEPRLEARLSGSAANLDITPIDDGSKVIDSLAPLEWLWIVAPKAETSGAQTLVVTLAMPVVVDGEYAKELTLLLDAQQLAVSGGKISGETGGGGLGLLWIPVGIVLVLLAAVLIVGPQAVLGRLRPGSSAGELAQLNARMARPTLVDADIDPKVLALTQRLTDILDEFFEPHDLRMLAHDLGVEMKNIAGEIHWEKANGLVIYLQQRDRLAELIEKGRRKNPGIEWPESPSG